MSEDLMVPGADADESSPDGLEGFVNALLDDSLIFGRTATSIIIEIIEDDIDAGNQGKIDHILISSRNLGKLIEEGTINVYHLQNAVAEDGYLVVLPEVNVGKYSYPIKVGSEETRKRLIRNYELATMTAENTVV